MGENNTSVKGVMISSTVAGYPAEKAGIKPGDVITEFDGKAIENTYQLLAQIIRHNVGYTVKVKVYRAGAYMDFDVTLAASPNQAS
jgi:S1-C subfamily serine protease